MLDLENRRPTFVTRPGLPELGDVLPYLERIWSSRVLTNGGPLAQELTVALQDYLGVAHLSLVSNCTSGCIAALRSLKVKGQVITSPFSFVATANSIVLAGAEPVFADIDPVSLNLDPEQVERHLTSDTAAIMPVHSFGNPCDHAALEEIANRRGIPLIYDAAHAFGVKSNGQSLTNLGTCSVVSFHATKVFNTFEGGAVITHDEQSKAAVERLINHGIEHETSVPEIGLNGKMSELHAAVGLAQLPYVDEIINQRMMIANKYSARLSATQGVHLVQPSPDVRYNYYMFPILLDTTYPMSRDELCATMEAEGIFPRRYFFPLVSDLPSFQHHSSAEPSNLPEARRVANSIVCLPIYPDLPSVVQDRIIEIVLGPTR
jgi:dTDP-4-amino-4,6-dideoxygalactose transaminase